MSKDLVPVSAGRDLITFENSKLELIRKTVAKDLNPPEFELFMSVARARGLDPILGQIHAVKRKDHKTNEYRMTIQVGIDGFRLIGARTGEYAGSDRTVFTYNKDQQVVSAEVTVYRLVNGTKCAFTASADWDEFYPGEKMGFMWKAKPKTMLGKCAEAQALRKAFPNDLSGLYEPAEIEVKEIKEEPLQIEDPKEKREKRITMILGSFAKLGISTKMIGEKYNIGGRDELTDDMIEDLSRIGKAISKDGKRWSDFIVPDLNFEEFK